MIFEKNISPEEIKLLPQAAFGGEIVVVDSEKRVDEACNYLLGCDIIGFDTETRPSFKVGATNKVALLQLSSAERCYLFRLCSMRFDKAILKVLESRRTLKVGVDVQGDIRNMNKIRRFRADGFVELQTEVERFGIEDKSLRKMAAIILGKSVSKAQRLSNWEARELTRAQLQYAATDAWICLEMYNRLLSER